MRTTAFILSTLLVVSANSKLASAQTDVEIQKLIEQLNAPKFADREQATNDLVVMGQPVIEPIALHYFDAGTESAWRTRRVLQQLATDSDNEETSIKAIGVLLLIDSEVDSDIAGLLKKWRRNRATRAVEYLATRGAITEPEMGNQNVIQRQAMLFSRTQNLATDQTRAITRRPPEKLSVEQAKKQIRRIVEADFAEIQAQVMDQLPGASDSSLAPDPFAVHAALQGIGQGTANGGYLEFGKDWSGSAADLQRLLDIHWLAAVRFSYRELPQAEVATVEKLDRLLHLGFNSAGPKKGDLSDIELPQSIVSMELANQKIDRQTARWLGSVPLQNLIIDSCEINESATDGLAAIVSLQSLDLRRIKIDRALFDALEELPALSAIYLSVCRFDPQDYQEFLQRNPRKSLILVPSGFLGVQRGPRNNSTRIDMVVPNSGAEAAGIQVGDIIKSVDGHEIEIFEDLRMHISQHEIGDEMEFQILRDGKQMTIKATLGENPNTVLR